MPPGTKPRDLPLRLPDKAFASDAVPVLVLHPTLKMSRQLTLTFKALLRKTRAAHAGKICLFGK